MSEHWIVVGAGSAGCVAAARLSEDVDRRVTLLEAGPDLQEGAVPPALDGPDFLAARREPGRVDDDLIVRRTADADPVPYATGRGVGGSSAVNALVGARGDPVQEAEWGWDDAAEAWARVRIPVDTAAADELGAVDRALLAAAPDARPAPLTRRAGRRVTSAEAYLWPARSRPNLDVRTGADVDHVVLDDRRAAGVALRDDTVLVADRVVVAAGAIHTPAILLRSGVDTPGVGVGIQDHPAAAVTLVLRDGVADGADASLIVGSLLDRGVHQVVPMNRLGDGPGGGRFGLLMVALMRPRTASGRVTVDATGDPVVDLRLLDDPADLAAMRDGVELLRELLGRPAFVDLVERAVVDEHGTRLDALAGVAVDRWLRTAGAEYLHAASSCRMGVVVGADGAVVGYDGLYLCDASVFPAIPTVNPHLPTTMLAERLAARWRAGRPIDRVG